MDLDSIMCGAGLQNLAMGRVGFPAPPEKNELHTFYYNEVYVQILCIFNQKQTPRSDSANLEPSEPIF